MYGKNSRQNVGQRNGKAKMRYFWNPDLDLTFSLTLDLILPHSQNTIFFGMPKYGYGLAYGLIFSDVFSLWYIISLRIFIYIFILYFFIFNITFFVLMFVTNKYLNGSHLTIVVKDAFTVALADYPFLWLETRKPKILCVCFRG